MDGRRAAAVIRDNATPSTKVASVGFWDWAASAIRGSGGEVGIDDVQFAPVPAAAQAAASWPYWWSPRTSVAAIPIERAELPVAGGLGIFPADPPGVRGGPDPTDPLAPAAASWPTEDVLGLTPGFSF